MQIPYIPCYQIYQSEWLESSSDDYHIIKMDYSGHHVIVKFNEFICYAYTYMCVEGRDYLLPRLVSLCHFYWVLPILGQMLRPHHLIYIHVNNFVDV